MVPKMALIRGNVGLDIRFLCSRPRKGTSLRRTASFGVFCVKIRPGALAVASGKNPKKTNTFWCAIWRAKSRMRGNETPGRIVSNFCTGVEVHDVITSANFYDSRVRGLSVAGVKFWASPLTCIVALTTLSHYRASVWYFGRHNPLPWPCLVLYRRFCINQVRLCDLSN